MPHRNFSFLSTTGHTLILDCEFEENHGHKTYKTIKLPEGRKAKPRFTKGSGYMFFVYKGESWYLLN